MKPRRWILAGTTLAAIFLCASLAAVASAAPVWKFNGTELSTTETAVGAAISSKLTIPGQTTECAHFLYNMKIKNSGGAGKGEITELPLYECKTLTASCNVESIAAEKLPWPIHLTTVGTKDYIVVEGVHVGIVYSGALCALEGLVPVTGSAGGVIENTAQTATFNKTTMEATGTSLKVGSSSVEWNGVFTTEAFESHREQLIEG